MKDAALFVLSVLFATPLVAWPIALIWSQWRQEEWRWRFCRDARRKNPDFKYPFND